MTPSDKPNLEIRATQPADLDPVLSNLAERTLREMDLILSDVPKDDRLADILADVTSAMATGHSDTLLLDGKALVIMTVTPLHDYHYTTFLPTEPFFDRKYLRLARPYCAALAKRVSTDLRAFSRSDHPEIDVWFRLQGFDFEGMDEEARVYIHRLSTGNSAVRG